MITGKNSTRLVKDNQENHVWLLVLRAKVRQTSTYKEIQSAFRKLPVEKYQLIIAMFDTIAV